MHGTGIFYYSGMGDYVRIYRAFSPRHDFYLVIFNSEGYEYLWKSPRYWFFWTARWRGIKAARKYLATEAAQIAPQRNQIISQRPLLTSKGFFETRKVPETQRTLLPGRSTRLFIEEVNL